MQPTSQLQIDLTAIDQNVNEWRRVLTPGTGICAVVKADAYGLGARALAMRLAAQNVDMLAVYSVKQATELAESGLNIPMLVLMPVDDINRTDTLYRATVDGRLHLTVHSERQLDAVEKIGTQFGATLPVHIELDSGMSRLGMSFEEAERVMPTFAERKYLRLAGVFTHPASADTDIFYTNRQVELLDNLIERNSAWIDADCAVHFAGTNAALRSEGYHKTMVRLGLGLFGYASCAQRTPPMLRDLPELRPAVRWISSIVHTLDVEARAGVGYHSAYKTTRASRLGIVPVGYADGYPTALGNKAVVRVGEELAIAPVRGEVNMDQITIDLTDIESAEVGTPVEVVSHDAAAPNTLRALSELGQCSMYEMLCRLSPRVPRRYIQQQGAGESLTPITGSAQDTTAPNAGKPGGSTSGGAGMGHARVAELRTAPNLSYDNILKRRA